MIYMFEIVGGMKIIAECSMNEAATTLELSRPRAVVMQPGPGSAVNVSLLPPTEPLFDTESINLRMGSVAFYIKLEGDNLTPRQVKIRDAYRSAVSGVIIGQNVQVPQAGTINGLY